MIARRRLIHRALAAMLVPAAWLGLASAAQAQAFQRFTPLLDRSAGLARREA